MRKGKRRPTSTQLKDAVWLPGIRRKIVEKDELARNGLKIDRKNEWFDQIDQSSADADYRNTKQMWSTCKGERETEMEPRQKTEEVD